ncbi:MAG: hypothetical protein ABJC07_06760 [Acidobacteriota bacterium]
MNVMTGSDSGCVESEALHERRAEARAEGCPPRLASTVAVARVRHTRAAGWTICSPIVEVDPWISQRASPEIPIALKMRNTRDRLLGFGPAP